MNRYVRHQIIRGSSRALSSGVIACALWRAWPIGTALWYVVLIMGPGMVFIWFPEQVDEYLFGTCAYGYRIDAHTPEHDHITVTRRSQRR